MLVKPDEIVGMGVVVRAALNGSYS